MHAASLSSTSRRTNSVTAAADLVAYSLPSDKLPGSVFAGMSELTELRLDNNGIVELPKEIQYLKQLKILSAR